jgi:hypothetical protein
VEICLTQEHEGEDVEDGIGSEILKAKVIKNKELTEEPGAGMGESTLHVAHEEHPFIVARSRLHLISRSVPDHLLLLREKARAGVTLELS